MIKGKKQKELCHPLHLLLTTALGGDTVIIPILQMRALRLREVSNWPKRPRIKKGARVRTHNGDSGLPLKHVHAFASYPQLILPC